MGIDRRTFLKGLGTGVALAAPGCFSLPGKLEAKVIAANRQFMGVLVDTTRCVGCRSCEVAGCVAACPVKAMEKREEGPVTWDTNCMGCRYCMVSCPFDIPKFEHHSAAPKLQKCNLCWERLQKGEKH